MQYTIRGIPDAVDRAIRERARSAGRSLNDIALEALTDGLGLGRESIPQRDLSDVAGSWVRDDVAEQAFAAQDHVDEDLWK